MPDRRCRTIFSILFCCVLVFIGRANAQFFVYQTHDLRLAYYDRAEEYLLPHIERCFENGLRFHERLFDYTPSEEVTVFLNDLNDYGSGGTNSIPWNYLNVGIEPFDYVYETTPTNERMNWMMNHELAHVVDLDKPSARDRFFRSLFFGKVAANQHDPVSMFYSYLASPRFYSPRWYHEGHAVFLETWMAGGIGRVLGGYDEMVFRTMVKDSSYFYDYVGLESEGKTIDFQIGANSYLYGTRFMSYLAAHYGPEKLVLWMNRTDSSRAYFASEFERLYGIGLDEEWTKWISWEHQWQRDNLDSIRQYPLTYERRLVSRGLGSVSRAFYDSSLGKVLMAVNFPGRIAHVAQLDPNNGSMETICEIATPALYYVASLAYDDSSKSLFFTTHNGSQWRDLYVVNVQSKNSTLLIKNSRVGDLVFNRADKSLWGVRHHAGYSTLVRIPPPYSSVYEIVPLQYGKDMFDLDISPDGKMLSSSFIEINGRQRLISFSLDSLMSGVVTVDSLYEFENNAPENFVFSRDGKYLFGTTYTTGVSNVVRYDLTRKNMQWLSNCETGYFRPEQFSSDSLIVFRYTGSGFLPVMIPITVREDVSAIKYLGQEIVDRYPIVKTWQVGSPLSVNVDSLTTYRGEYHPLEHIRLASMYPIVEGYKNIVSYGLAFNAGDPVGLHSLELTSTYSPYPSLASDERLHFTLEYHYWQWKVNATYNGTDFYDLFGPTKTSRKGYSLSLSYTDLLMNDKPSNLEYSLHVSGYGGLDRLPDFQNIATSFDKFLIFGGRLSYTRFLRSLGAVESEKGFSWSLHSVNTVVQSTTYPQVYAAMEYGMMLPIDHSSLWLRGTAGYSPGEINSPFANFYFGGFGNNYVDYQNIQRYREYYSFPGVDLNEIGGTKFGKMQLEWTMPPMRFRRLGIPNLYCTWSRIALFSSVIGTNFDDEATRRTLVDVGSQMDVKFVFFANLESTLSFGYAVAFERDQRASREFMISLKIM